VSRQSEITPEGLKQLEEEIEHLSTVRRREVSERIREARDFGDISENAEYDDAKNEQAQLEQQIALLEERLRRSTVVEEAATSTGEVAFGSIVHIKDQESGTSKKFQIVGSTEADLAGGKLSSESPIGSALIGGKINDIVKIPAPRGPEKLFKITKIEAA
jgi:transcription elongation factor GreA